MGCTKLEKFYHRGGKRITEGTEKKHHKKGGVIESQGGALALRFLAFVVGADFKSDPTLRVESMQLLI